MIKIGIRQNLIYPILFISFNFFRNVVILLMETKCEFSDSVLLIFVMFFGEFIAGLILYSYQYNFISRKRSQSVFMGIKLIEASSDMKHPDSNFKIYSLIFFSSFLDFVQYSLSTIKFPIFEEREGSKSLNVRLKSILIISSVILCYFLLKFKILKHQLFSLLIISVCFIIVIISEYYFEKSSKNGITIEFLFSLISILIGYLFYSIIDIIEKYLLEYNFLNPFHMLMYQGFFGCLITPFFLLVKNDDFRKIKDKFEKEEDWSFVLFLILLVLYFLFSGARNSYRVLTNKIFSPTSKTLADCFLDPALIIYYFFNEDKLNIAKFIINLIISIILVFCSCIYNEVFIIFCYNMEYETYYEIRNRATTNENLTSSVEENNDDDKNNEEENNEDYNSSNSSSK